MSLLVALGAAAWLGILTSVSPCPLATNVAAVSLLARRLQSRRAAIGGVAAYAAGRALAYVAVGLLLTLGLAAAPEASRVLQRVLLPFIGPLLIVVGLVLLGWLPWRLGIGLARPGSAEGLADRGLLGALLLGVLFALTFCPISAALFFGTLLPLALASESATGLFAAYGVATAAPVAAVALLVVAGTGLAGRVMQDLQRWQGRVQALTAWIIIGVGAFLTLTGPLGLF